MPFCVAAIIKLPKSIPFTERPDPFAIPFFDEKTIQGLLNFCFILLAMIPITPSCQSWPKANIIFFSNCSVVKDSIADLRICASIV